MSLSISRRARYWQRCIALLGALVACQAAGVAAQQDICFQAPNATPDFAGLPRWPLPGETIPPPNDPNLPPRAQRLNGLVSDPRWSGAPLRGMFVDDVLTTFNDFARYRVLVDRTNNPTQLAVTIQIRSTADVPTTDDYVYFGISNNPAIVPPATSVPPNQFNAWGVRVVLQSSGDRRYSPVTANGNVSHYTLTNNSWTSVANSIPTWIVPNTLAIWYLSDNNEAALNGAKLAVQFKVNLTNLPGISGASARMMVGAKNDFGAAGGVHVYSVPSFAPCEPNCQLPATPSTVPQNPFLANLASWAPVSVVGSACEGISINSSDIAANHDRAADPGRDCNGRSNCISARNGVRNTFSSAPNVPATWSSGNPRRRLENRSVVSTFKMSNWGTVAQPSEWRTLGVGYSSLTDAAGQPIDGNDLDSNPIIFQCNNNAQGNVCLLPTTVDYTNPQFHQCLLAELSANRADDTTITFANTAAYINTRFEQASLIDRTAEINVRGLANLDPSNPNRDVYLQLVRTNMVAAGQTRFSLNVPALEATRRQVDRDFSARTGGCKRAEDVCLPLDGPSYAGCASECSATPAGAPECPTGRTAYSGTNGCYCLPTVGAQLERCTYTTEPLNGGYNPDSSSLDGTQTITAQYPTVMVYPFYDSGRTLVENGVTKKRLVPMPSFGIHAWHVGDFYGWLTRLVDESGAAVQEVSPDVFKISVSKSTGTRRVRLLVSAEEQATGAPMTEIAGSAVLPATGFSSMSLTGVTRTTPNVDLSAAQLTLTRLLTEGTTERVTNLGAPVVLTRVAGASPYSATFRSSGAGKPTISITLTNLPLIGQTVQINASNATISRPSACPQPYGAARLVTEFSLRVGTSPPVVIRGDDQWNCGPTSLNNY